MPVWTGTPYAANAAYPSPNSSTGKRPWRLLGKAKVCGKNLMGTTPMGRPFNDDLSTPWKINMPATLAGKIEFLLLDPIHAKPIYASRNRLIVSLLSWWEAREAGRPEPHVPTIEELRRRS